MVDNQPNHDEIVVAHGIVTILISGAVFFLTVCVGSWFIPLGTPILEFSGLIAAFITTVIISATFIRAVDRYLAIALPFIAFMIVTWLLNNDGFLPWGSRDLWAISSKK